MHLAPATALEPPCRPVRGSWSRSWGPVSFPARSYPEAIRPPDPSRVMLAVVRSVAFDTVCTQVTQRHFLRDRNILFLCSGPHFFTLIDLLEINENIFACWAGHAPPQIPYCLLGEVEGLSSSFPNVIFFTCKNMGRIK